MTKKRWIEWQKSTHEVKQIYCKKWDNHKFEYYVKPILDTKCGDKVVKVEFKSCGKEMTAWVYVQRPGRMLPTCCLMHREWVNKVIFN